MSIDTHTPFSFRSAWPTTTWSIASRLTPGRNVYVWAVTCNDPLFKLVSSFLERLQCQIRRVFIDTSAVRTRHSRLRYWPNSRWVQSPISQTNGNRIETILPPLTQAIQVVLQQLRVKHSHCIIRTSNREVCNGKHKAFSALLQ